MNDIVERVKAGQLSLVAEAPRLLASIAQISDTAVLKEQKAQAVAIAVYLAQRRDQSVEEHNAALKIKLRIEHRLGEVLDGMVIDTREGGNNVLHLIPDGISRMESSRAQQLAALLWQEIEERIEEKTENNQKASASLVIGEIRQERIKAEEEKAAAEATTPDREAVEQMLRTCSMQDLLASLKSVDAIITDPPYPREFLDLYSELARLAKGCLAPTGILAVMCGQSYLPEVFDRMCEHLPYRWTMSYYTPGPFFPQWQRNILITWKPVLLFGSCEGRRFLDSIRSDTSDKRFHEWGQSESGMLDLVEKITQPGQLVCDPFLGGGTTGVACLALGRRFVGCDSDPQCVEKARQRLLLMKKNRAAEVA
jgi:hypothetical protein